jgi:general secretion pathway protein L
MKPTRLILIPALGSEPAPCLVIDGGGVRERGLLDLHPVERPEPMHTVAIVPGPEVTIRWLDLPAGGQSQQRAAALWMLREELAETEID